MFRIKAYSRLVKDAPGYLSHERKHYQDLQEKHWYGWKTIDSEEVPAHVIISNMCFGDTGGWLSKFAHLGKFGRDGIIRER